MVKKDNIPRPYTTFSKLAIVGTFREVICCPDQCSRNSYVDDNSCLLVSSFLLYFSRCLRIETSTYTNVKE
jgi:hypothetical protein